MRSSRHRLRTAGLSIILPPNCAKLPGLCLKHIPKPGDKILLGNVTGAQTAALGTGIVAGYVGLYYLNKMIIKYRRAKARKEVDKQQDIILLLANRVRQKNPSMGKERAYMIAHRALEEQWIHRYEEKLHAKYAVDPETGLTKDEEDYLKNLGKPI